MAYNKRFLRIGPKTEEEADAPAHSRMRSEYCGGIILSILLSLMVALALGLVFGLGSSYKDVQIKALQTTNAHLETELMGLMMTTLTFTTRYMQNGTCTFGFPLAVHTAVQTVADYSDYVTLNYTLKEILLTPASIPLTVLEISATPRPIVFPGYTPSLTLPKDNDLEAILAMFDPPIATLDTVATNGFNLAYSYVMASRIAIAPNCVAMSLADHNPAHCTEENAYSPYFSSSYPSPNGVQIFTNNLKVAGDANMQFLWGQWNYLSFLNQYDFTGTTLEFTAPFEMLLPNV